MARDRSIRFQSEPPSMSLIKQTTEGFMGTDIGTIQDSGDDCLMVLLPGKGTHPFRDHIGREERWFEIFRGDNFVLVTTREQDPLTNAIADGFASAASVGWCGSLEM